MLFGFIAGGILLCVIGIIMLADPELAWKFRTRHYVERGEPTDFAIIATRIRGAIYILAGITAAVCLVIVPWVRGLI